MKKLRAILMIVLLVMLLGSLLTACSDTGQYDAQDVYKIIFDVNKGSGNNQVVFTNARNPIIMPDTPIREGYAFEGWYFDIGVWRDELTPNYLMTKPLKTQTATVYAKWRSLNIPPVDTGDSGIEPGDKPTYTVSFIPGRSQPQTINVREQLVEENIPFLYETDYDFMGWYFDEDFTASLVLPLKLSGDIVLYGKWEPKRYQIIFNGGEGATSNAPTVNPKIFEEKFTLPANTFVKQGYQFVGWRHSVSDSVFPAGSVYTLQHRLAITFTAVWEKLYTISFSGGEDSGGVVPAPIVGVEGVRYTLPQNSFIKLNHIFVGWTLAESSKLYQPLQELVISEDCVFIANWVETYFIIFEGGGENDVEGVSPTVEPKPHGANFEIPQNTFLRNGYVFIHWLGDDQNIYHPGDEFTMPQRGVRFIAVWTPNLSYPIIFDGGPDAKGTGPSESPKTYGQTFELPKNNFIRDNYTFDGWSVGENIYQPGDVFTMEAEPVVFSAVWTPTEFSITYYIITGASYGGNPTTYTVETETFTLKDLSMEGYVFEGWFDDAVFETEANTTIRQGSSGNKTFYAKMVPAKNKIYLNDYMNGSTLIGVSGRDEKGAYITATYGEDYLGILEEVSISREGYFLSHWAYQGSQYVPSETWTNLEDITLDAMWSMIGTAGLSFTPINNNKEYTVSPYNGSAEKIVIPSYFEKKPIVAISNNAFSSASGVTEITLPPTLKSIGSYAFSGSNIKKLNIPQGIEYIGEKAFAGSRLQRVSFEEGSFLSELGEGAFSGCTSLEYINLPQNIINMESLVFDNCPILKIYSRGTGEGRSWKGDWNPLDRPIYWGVDSYQNYYYITADKGIILVEYMGEEKDITVPDEINGVAVWGLADKLFYRVKGAETITLPQSINHIGQNTFLESTIQKIVLLHTQPVRWNLDWNMGRELIYDNGYLATINGFSYLIFAGSAYVVDYLGGDSVLTIPSEINLSNEEEEPQMVEVVGLYNAFNDMKGLWTGEIHIPLSVLYMVNSFYNSPNITIFAEAEGMPAGWKEGYMGNTHINFAGGQYIEEGSLIYWVENGEATIIRYEGGNVNLDIPSEIEGYPVTGIQEGAFQNTSLRSLTIPQGVVNISIGAFINSSNLTVYLERNLASGEESWFLGITLVDTTSINIERVLGQDLIPVLEYYLVGEGVVITKYLGDEKTIDLSGEINGQEIYKIYHRAFYGIGLLEIALDNGISHIGRDAFAFNEGLVITLNGIPNINWQNDWNSGYAVEFTALDNENEFFRYTIDNGNAYITEYIGVEREVIIPATIDSYPVVALLDGAFSGNVNITKVTIESQGLTYIGDRAFYNCQQLGYINIPAQVSYIGDYAFYGCRMLLEAPIPQNVKTIGKYAFYDARMLKEVTLPQIDILEGTFENCFTLSSVKTLGLLSVQANAFKNCYELRVIENTSSIAEIGKGAFENCRLLSKFEFNQNLTRIESYAFAGSHFLSEINLPESLTYIGDYSFYECKGLQGRLELPTALKVVGARAFYGAFSGLDLYVGAGVISIGQEAFAFSEIINISVDNENKGYKSEDGVLYNKSGSQLIQYATGSGKKSFEVPSSVVTIAPSAFRKSTELNTITIPLAVLNVGEDNFIDCPTLTIYTAHSIPPYGWRENWNGGSRPVYWSLDTLSGEHNGLLYIIEKGEITITRYVGEESYVIIPSEIDEIPVTKVGKLAFSGSGIRGVFIPQSIARIGEYAFMGSTIPALYLERADIDFATNWNRSGVGAGAFDLPIYNEQVWSYNGLQYIIVDGKITITRYVGQSIVIDVPSEIEGYEVTTIEKYAFAHTTLRSVILPASITSVKGSAFGGGISTVIYVKGSTTGFQNNWNRKLPFYEGAPLVDGEFEYIVINGASVITRYTGEGIAEIVVPSHLGGYQMQKIGDYAFEGLVGVKKVTIPSTVKTIGIYAFSNCADMEDVVFEEGSLLTNISNYAFNYCLSLTSFEIPLSVTNMGIWIFYGSTNLQNLTYEGGSTPPLGWAKGWNLISTNNSITLK